MVEYNKANAKLLDSQLNKLKCAIDAGIQKKIHISGTTILIITNKEMEEFLKNKKEDRFRN